MVMNQSERIMQLADELEQNLLERLEKEGKVHKIVTDTGRSISFAAATSPERTAFC